MITSLHQLLLQKTPPNKQTGACKPRSCGVISVCRLFAGVCLFAQNTYVSFGGLKMSLQMVFKCPAKLYTLKIFTHNRIREHPKEPFPNSTLMFPSKWRTTQMAQIRLIGATLICLFHRQIADFNDRCQNSVDIDAVSDHQATHKFYLSERSMTKPCV